MENKLTLLDIDLMYDVRTSINTTRVLSAYLLTMPKFSKINLLLAEIESILQECDESDINQTANRCDLSLPSE